MSFLLKMLLICTVITINHNVNVFLHDWVNMKIMHLRHKYEIIYGGYKEASDNQIYD